MKLQTVLLQVPYRLDYFIQKKNAIKLYAQKAKEQQNKIQIERYDDSHSSGHSGEYRRNTTAASKQHKPDFKNLSLNTSHRDTKAQRRQRNLIPSG
jgi:hypothetical protein